jgi:hypothetical protein
VYTMKYTPLEMFFFLGGGVGGGVGCLFRVY